MRLLREVINTQMRALSATIYEDGESFQIDFKKDGHVFQTERYSNSKIEKVSERADNWAKGLETLMETV